MLALAAPPLTVGTDRVGWSVAEVATFRGVDELAVRKLIALGLIAFVRLSPGRIVVLEGDVGAAQTIDDGRATLRSAWRGRRRVRVRELATALGVSLGTLCSLARSGELPAKLERGRWTCDRDELVRWLLARRVPPRWEIA